VTDPIWGVPSARALASVCEMFDLTPGPAKDALIGIATGVVMESRDCTSAEARTLLRDTAQRNHLTVCEMAERAIADRDLG
jgi:AmiR/NasT family two-component response regulator